MKLSSTSQIVLAGLALTGSSLAAPASPLPYDSPVNSPNPADDWESAGRSPRLHRSPFPDSPRPVASRLIPADRRAGGVRRSLPRYKRQEPPAEDAPADAPPPEDEAAAPQGLLIPVVDAVTGLLHSVVDAVHAIPGIGDLGILAAPEDAPQADQEQEALPSPSTLQARDFFTDAPVPAQPPITVEQISMLQNIVMDTLQQQQAQAQEALGMLSAASGSGQPPNPQELAARLQGLLSAQNQATGALNSVFGTAQGVLGGIPLVGQTASGLLGGASGLTGALPNVGQVAGGLFGTAGGAAGGLLGSTPLGGLVGATPLGGLLGGGGGGSNPLSGLLGGATGPLNGLLGGAGAAASPLAAAPQGLGIWSSSQGAAPAQAGPHYPFQDGFYPHSAPPVPANSPATPPAAFPFFGSFAQEVDNLEDVPVSSSSAPADAQPTQTVNDPADSPSSVPMDHSSATLPVEPSPASDAPMETLSSTETPTSTETSSDAASSEAAAAPVESGNAPPAPLVGTIGRRQEGGDDANFAPSIPSQPSPEDLPPLLAPRSAKGANVRASTGTNARAGANVRAGSAGGPKVLV